MLLLPCPFCGPRSEQEFICAGEAVDRPDPQQVLDDAAWADHLYSRDNPDDPVRERWWHVQGCRAWLSVHRDPHTQRILSCTAQVQP